VTGETIVVLKGTEYVFIKGSPDPEQAPWASGMPVWKVREKILDKQYT